MAVYIEILKLSETATTALFDFFPDGDEQKAGRVELDKTTGTVRELIQSPVDPRAFFFERVAVKLKQHHLQAEYPQLTCWAS